MRRILSVLLTGMLASGPVAAQQGVTPAQSSGYRLSVDVSTVLTNVVARDKRSGEVIKGLKASDFTILEDNKPQRITSFDYQNVDQAAKLALQQSTTGGAMHAKIDDLLQRNFAAGTQQLRDHRLIVMFFDLSSMQDEDIDRAVDAALKYVQTQMQPADLVALVSFSSSLSLDQDFTNDKDALARGLNHYNGNDQTAFAATDTTSDDASSFQADDTEYENLNTDRELFAIRQVAQSLERVDQRKSMLYFSGGISRNGIENQASLRAATNEAAKANMAIYAVDSRGLQAMPPVGDATKGSQRGTSAYTGAAVAAQFSANQSSQEILDTLSRDTGGKAFFDSNDFGPAFQQVQHDTEAYYIVGFRSSNPKRDGVFRHLTIKVNRPDVRLEYRPGYYAPADFLHQKTEDRELALNEQLRSDLPALDVNLYVQALYFRENPQTYFVPVELVVPGSQINAVTLKDRSKATLDIVGQVKNGQDLTVGHIRDTVKLALDANQQVQRKNIQYSTGFILAPGRYTLKFVVRENQSGNMGSFETTLNVPNLKDQPIKLSSVVLASQRRPVPQGSTGSLLIREGEQYVPNLAHIFRQDQHLLLLYELYDPSPEPGAPTPAASPGLARREGGPVRVLSSIEFLNHGAKVFETPLVTADVVNVPDRNAVAFQLDVPLDALKPGAYLCQVNVVDDAGGRFVFPRIAVRIVAGAAAVEPH